MFLPDLMRLAALLAGCLDRRPWHTLARLLQVRPQTRKRARPCEHARLFDDVERSG